MVEEKSYSIMSRIRTILRLFISVTLASSAGAKFFWPREFEKSLQAMGFFPNWSVTPLAWFFPAVEIALAFAIATRLRPASGFLILSGLLSTTFVGLHGFLIWSGTVVPCGCLGVTVTHSSLELHIVMLLLTLFMAASSYLLLFLDESPVSLQGHASVMEQRPLA